MSMFIVRRAPNSTAELSVPPLLRRIYAARGVRSDAELSKELRCLTSPAALKNVDRAVDLLHTALRERWRILIVADFDADGATSCALAVRVLRAMGAAWVGYRVPNRFEHSYGLTPEIVAVAAQDRPDLLITVDNGISSHEGVRAAQGHGMRVLITDHHLPGQDLPPAEAIVNPNQPDDAFPGKCLAGVGVIFYVLSALRARLRERGWFVSRGLAEPNMAQFLDLVALGTVADVVPLDHLNRVLIEQGLRRIRQGSCVAGILALCAVSGRNPQRLTSSDIAFYLAPRLNAAGRLEDMSRGIECLLNDDPAAAETIARQLDATNRRRGDITAAMQAQALRSLDRLLLTNDNELPLGLCLFDDGWHQGVVGIIAGRLRETTHRPVIVFAPDRDGRLKGSGRSVDGVHLRDVLAAVATDYPGLIHHFGGHAMAVGLTLAAERFAAFAQAFDAEVRRRLGADDLHGRLLSDGELEAGDFTLELAEQLREAGPWGQGFPEPLFDGVFEVVSHQVLKDRHLKLWLRPPDTALSLEAIAFQRADTFDPGTARVRIAYRLDSNEWRGTRLQLRIEHLEPA